VLGAEGSEAPLVELHELPGASPVPAGGRLGLYHVALLLPDRPSLGSFLLHLSALGQRAGASDHLVSEAIYLRDPDGLGIEVYADRPRDSWSVQDGELRMESLPLDGADVARAAQGARWSALPAGTRVGHVHLHIGDLDEASAFYHDGLGFDRMVWSYPGALFLSAGGYHHHLGLNTWAVGGTPTDSDARLLDWEIALPRHSDVEAAAASLRGAGHDVVGSGAEIRVRDPWGTTLRLTSDVSPGRLAPSLRRHGGSCRKRSRLVDECM
jgi:catechol 2,3-dioxygenase